MYWILTRSRKWVTVEPLLFLSVFSNFIAYPTTVQLVYDLVCVATPNCSRSSNLSASQPPAQVEQEIQTVSSHILLFSNLALGVPSAFVSFLFGHLSDSQGRKTFILLACMMSALSKYMMTILVYLSLDVYFVVLANFLDGCGGSFPVLNLLFYAYVADTSTTTQRTSRVGILESMFYFAATLGGLLSGIIIQNAGYGVVYLLAMACHVVAVLYVVLALPESVNSSSRGRTRERAVDNPRWKQLLSTIWSVVRNDRFQAIVCVLFLVIFFSTQMIFLGLNDIDYLFVLGPPLSWTHELLGYFAAYMLGLNGIAALLVLPLLSWCRINDYIIVCIGLFSGILLLVGIGISTETWHMFVAATLGTLRSMYTPTLRSMLSKIASKEHEGVMFAALSVLQTVATILASVIYNSVYPPTRKVWPGLSFVLMATTLVPPLIAMIVIWGCTSRYRPCGHSHRAEQDKPLL